MLGFLNNLIFIPLEYILDCIFCALSRFTDNLGLSVLGLSIVVNFLVLPLYNKSDAIQEKERQRQKELERWVSHIKKTFSGNERYMMMSAYYKEQNYKPVYALKGSISLLLQIPFFIAAYRFLSGLTVFDNVSFLFLKDLSKPDGLLKIGSLSINFMPVLMTLINIISGMIYTRGFSFKEKAQLYGMAGIFLILLYNSPSVLVLYWTMNNIFSLLKNVFTKLFRHPALILKCLVALAGVSVFVYEKFFGDDVSWKVMTLSTIIAFAGFVPIILHFMKRNKKSRPEWIPSSKVYVLSSLFCALFTGLAIPTITVSASPVEFIVGGETPLKMIFSVFTIVLGFFVLWGSVFFFLCAPKGRRMFQYAIWTYAAVAICDFFFFGKNLGVISSFLVFDAPKFFLCFINLILLSLIDDTFSNVSSDDLSSIKIISRFLYV